MCRNKRITVLPYDPNWPKLFEEEARLIQQQLGNHCLAVYHIGSTSVPGLSAKADIDILCVVDHLDHSLALEELGYTFKGEFNIPLRFYFSKNTSYSKVNLHVTEKDHGFIPLNLCFRDYLRAHKETRFAYEKLKDELLRDPASYKRTPSTFSGYNLGKDQFIKATLEKAGFDATCLNFCMHEREWNAYHRICEEYLIKPRKTQHDRHHFHFVLYKGTTIIGTAHIELLSHEESAIRSCALDTPFQKQGYESLFIALLEKWLLQKKQRVVHVHVEKSVVSFYVKNGYRPMPFHDDKSELSSDSVDMGKIL